VSVAATKLWPTKRLRFLTSRKAAVQERKRPCLSEVSFLPMEAIGEQGQLDTSITRPIEEVESGYSQFSNGDVVIAKITPCFENGKGSLIRGMLGGIGYGTTELHVLTPGPEIDGRFLYYITVDPRFRRLGEANMTGAAGQQRVPEEFIRNYLVPVPPLNVQRAIADYLDRETARIDALIAAKKRLLELLAEKRRALITRAVTRGLDPHAPMRDSGIPWLGEIPEDWQTAPLRYLCQLDPPVSFSGFAEDDEVTFLPMEHIKSGYYIPNNAPLAKYNSSYSVFEEGDILIAKVTPCFENGNITITENLQSGKGFGTSEIFVLRSRSIDRYFIFYFLQSMYFRQNAEASMTGAGGLKRVSPELLRQHHIPVPSANVQRAIVDYLDHATARLDALRAATERSIALLKERRAALISAAVTGQIEAPARTASTADREAVP
jgi:type I restriction enzyme S subunit